MEDDRALFLKQLIGTSYSVSEISGFKCVVKKQCLDLSRRVKMLIPMFEEFVEMKEDINEEIFRALFFMMEALRLAEEFLEICSRRSKIYMVLNPEQMKRKFHELTVRFEESLSRLSYLQLNIPNEIKEQVELIHAQFGRAKKRINAPYSEQYEELSSIGNVDDDTHTNSAILNILCTKLELTSIEDLKQEAVALYEIKYDGNGCVNESVGKMLKILKRIEVLVHENRNDSTYDQPYMNLSPKSPIAPHDFHCPISLELMKDPVIICTGQTYERVCIRRWLEAGHKTCPKTRQNLFNTVLIPNYALLNLITHWCETNGLNPLKISSYTNKSFQYPVASMEIIAILNKLASSNIENQRAAAGELRLLAKNNLNNRQLIAEAGSIPLLTDLCYSLDGPTQEHSVTALLNLSLSNHNKPLIINAVPAILHTLKNGTTTESRENAAATVCSLSVSDEYKVIIGELGAVPELVNLLKGSTTLRGKKDASKALFRLLVLQENKSRAVRANMVPLLRTLLTEPNEKMIAEALALMSLLASHPEGKVAIGGLDVLPVFAKIIESGVSDTASKENAASILVRICGSDCQLLLDFWKLGVMIPLLDLAENGSNRGKRKAAQLIELMANFAEQQEHSNTQR